MKLRNKVLLILSFGLVGLSASFYLVSRALVIRNYAALENQQVDQDVNRVLDALSNNIDALSSQAFDYSHWDDTYQYMVDEDKEFIENSVSILNMKVNAVLLISPSKEILSAQGADLEQQKETPISKALINQIYSSNLLLNHTSPDSAYKGIIQLPEGPMMLVSYPVVTSEGEGPIRGTLILGRYLNQSAVEQLESLTKLPDLTVERFDSPELPPDFQAAKQSLLNNNTVTFVQPLNENSIAGYALITDISGKPALLMRMVEPRKIYAQGQASLNYLVVSILIMGAIFSAVIILLLEKSILSRLSRLNNGVSQIGAGGISDERVTLSGEDELSNLAGTFNAVLDQLQQSQAILQQNAEQLQQQNTTIADLSRNESLVQGDAQQATRIFLEATAKTLGIERVSVWLYNSDRSQLTCLDRYDRVSNQHLDGMKLQYADCPRYFEALSQNSPIIAEDAQSSPPISEFALSYLKPNNIASMLIFPIQTAGRTVGIICCEQTETRRQWKPEEQTFIYSIANLVSLALESETLQSEIEHLLDVVSVVGDGNLSVQAQVSDRVTGLVADLFNRLTERLAHVLKQVLDAAHQVSEGANLQQELAKTVAINAEQQAQAVTQVLHLTEQVERSAQDSAEQVNTASRSLRSVSTTVSQGREAINALTQGIQVLQDGSDRIMQQMKTLGEFVGLADQFVQDQGQIAFVTQTLALNASLVAARASEQRDPRQFLVVAREFDSIADQVKKLAQQTNEGLVTLERRSAQIHSVVSAIDTDVQSLGELVRGFTYGVEQSNQVFSNVQTVTGEALEAGEAVSQLNHKIMDAAQSTAEVMRGIAQLAAKTAELTQVSQRQSDQIDALSTQLLQSVQFFQLPELDSTIALPEVAITYPNPELETSEVRSERYLNASSEMKPEIESEIQSEIASEIEPEVDIASDVEAKTGSNLEADLEADLEIRSEEIQSEIPSEQPLGEHLSTEVQISLSSSSYSSPS